MVAGGAGPVHDGAGMIRQMAPERRPGRWLFCTLASGASTTDAPLAPDVPAPELRDAALASVREPEGLSLVLPLDLARAHGLGQGSPVLAHVLLRVHSALEGVGLTAAVAETLAAAGIACNVVAGRYHDHLLVPEARADEAVRLLETRARQEREPQNREQGARPGGTRGGERNRGQGRDRDAGPGAELGAERGAGPGEGQGKRQGDTSG